MGRFVTRMSEVDMGSFAGGCRIVWTWEHQTAVCLYIYRLLALPNTCHLFEYFVNSPLRYNITDDLHDVQILPPPRKTRIPVFPFCRALLSIRVCFCFVDK